MLYVQDSQIDLTKKSQTINFTDMRAKRQEKSIYHQCFYYYKNILLKKFSINYKIHINVFISWLKWWNFAFQSHKRRLVKGNRIEVNYETFLIIFVYVNS